MKHLEEYINESIIGEIILKVVDAGLGWIGKGLDALKDLAKTSTDKTWDIITAKNATWNDIERDKMSKKYQQQYQGILKIQDPVKRERALDKLRKDWGLDSRDDESTTAAIMLAYTHVKETEAQAKEGKATKDDVKAAKEYLEKIKKLPNGNKLAGEVAKMYEKNKK